VTHVGPARSRTKKREPKKEGARRAFIRCSPISPSNLSEKVRYGSRLCENAKAINRDRTSYSFKTVSCAEIASAFNFEIEIKNIILVALRTYEFSHGLGHSRLDPTAS
jgi:hypothetical protein